MTTVAQAVRFGSITTQDIRPSTTASFPKAQNGALGLAVSKNGFGWSQDIWKSNVPSTGSSTIGQDFSSGGRGPTILGPRSGTFKSTSDNVLEETTSRPRLPQLSSISDLWPGKHSLSSAELPSALSERPKPTASSSLQWSTSKEPLGYKSGLGQWSVATKPPSTFVHKSLTDTTMSGKRSILNDRGARNDAFPGDSIQMQQSFDSLSFGRDHLLYRSHVIDSRSLNPCRPSDVSSIPKVDQRPPQSTSADTLGREFFPRSNGPQEISPPHVLPSPWSAMGCQATKLSESWPEISNGNAFSGPWNKYNLSSNTKRHEDRIGSFAPFDRLGFEDYSRNDATSSGFGFNNLLTPQLQQNMEEDRPNYLRSEPDILTGYPSAPSTGSRPPFENICTANEGRCDAYLGAQLGIRVPSLTSTNYSTLMRKPYLIDEPLAGQAQLHSHATQDYTRSYIVDRAVGLQSQENNSWVSHYLIADQARNHYMSQVGQGYLGNTTCGIPGYGGLPPSLYQPRLPMNGCFQESHADHGVRSALLEEFRMNIRGPRRYELREIYDHIVEFAGDQHGSRFIQTKLETANSDEKERLFRELLRDAIPLMRDVFGNYVIQKMFEHGDQNQKKILVNKMKGHILDLTTQVYGCRVVQKALQYVLVDQQVGIISELERHVLKCVRDQHGNHVIQKMIELVPFAYIHFIVDAFVGQTHHLATHPYGCRVVQRLLEYSEEPARSNILHELHAHASNLIADQYGNYVIQNVVEQGSPEDREKVFEVVKSNLIAFSRQKFASNVVEKCLTHGTDEQRREVMHTLCVKNRLGESALPLLIRDSFGNYVIQKLLRTLNPADKAVMNEMLEPEVLNAFRTPVNYKQANNVAKHMHAFGPALPFEQQLRPTLPFIQTDSSAMSTPPLTADGSHSPMSSSLPSTIGDGIPTKTEETPVPLIMMQGMRLTDPEQ